jgi:hypothetical protein
MSKFLNSYLQAPAFTVSDDSNSRSGEATSSVNVVSGDLRTVIGTQGIDDSEGVDAELGQQSPRFDQGIQKLGL